MEINMKTLLVMRHAKSSWDDSGLADHDRPLNARGKRDAPLMGRWLLQEDLVPEEIITSTAKRALATAEAVAGASDFENEIKVDRFYYHADAEMYTEGVKDLPDEIQLAMIIGHNPGLEDLV
jgi:phosphohistidine phosphatase